MVDETYNGWSNRETWAVALHLDNDQVWQNTVSKKAKEFLGEFDFHFGDWIQGYVDKYLEAFWDEQLDFNKEIKKAVAMMIQDVGSFWRVDWTEVANHYLEEERIQGEVKAE